MSRKYHDRFFEGEFYHIFNKTINSELLFKSRRNYDFFLRRWKEYIGDLLDVYAYCLLPTHFHFLVQVPWRRSSVSDAQSVTNAAATAHSKILHKPISKAESSPYPDVNTLLEHQFELYFRSYAQAFNKEQKRTGSLFQKRFRRIFIDDERFYVPLIHAIHLNPIYHNVAAKPDDWRYSSYSALLSCQDTCVKRARTLKCLGSQRAVTACYSQIWKYIEPVKYWLE